MQVLVNGTINGLTIAVMALAFQLVYLPTNVFHVTLAAVYVLTPFVAWALLHAGVAPAIAFALAIVAGVALSWGSEHFNHARIERRHGSFSAQFISSLGIYIVVVQTTALVWGNEQKVLRLSGDPIWRLGSSVAITESQFWVVVGAIVILAAFFVWLHFSSIGLRYRALADNPKELAVRGFNIRNLRYGAFVISGVMGAVLGLLTARDTGFWTHGGLPDFLLAMVASIIGGRSTFLGPVLGGLMLGILRHEVEWHVNSRWVEACTFLALAAFLVFRPGGILELKARLEAQQR
ncbi:MAG: branched-chain amino acid ABC transporter permease [Alphaproteobacteria bacterium]|nr:branched-chain amino acid ABC transporter permease [Alphaproteobacteria bacterium]